MNTALILLPVAGALVVWLLPLGRIATGGLALLVALAEVGLWVNALVRLDFDAALPLQYEERARWFGDLGVSYHVGLYPFAVWLVGLTVVVSASAIGYGVWAGRDRPRAYFGLLLFLTGATVGVFSAQDLLVFYVFFEAMLIPLYVLVGVWGGPGRLGATIKFVLYTMAGSLLMLAAIVVYGLQRGTFDMLENGQSGSTWLFLGFAIAFAIKAPLFPFHGWLPDAYRESTPEVAALLSGVISKAAVYGFFRICFGEFPEPFVDLRVLILALAAAGLVYGSLLAFRAADLRGIVAYSSLAQMGLITIGLFANNLAGISGAILQAVNHGLVSASLFLLVGAVERRAATSDLTRLGGMAKGRPVLATLVMVAGIIALAVPGSATFAGEFLILVGIFDSGWGWAVVGAAAIVLAAMYALRLISAVLHGRRGPAIEDGVLDLRPAEVGVIVPLLAALIALSIWPAAISGNVLGLDERVAAFEQALDEDGR